MSFSIKFDTAHIILHKRERQKGKGQAKNKKIILVI
jgi:hypothetical protein